MLTSVRGDEVTRGPGDRRAGVGAGGSASLGFGSAAGTCGRTGDSPSLPGLRGTEFELAGGSARPVACGARLVCRAVALGVGRAAVDHAVAAMKPTGVKPAATRRCPLGDCRQRRRKSKPREW